MPKAVLNHFSSLLDDCFPSPDNLHVNRNGCDGEAYATVYGGVRPAFGVIFQWMFSSCQNQRIERIDRLDFAQYARLHEAAEYLDIPWVVNEMVNRMNKMSKSQIPIKCIRIIYANFPKESLPRQVVIRSIGNAVFERRLRRWDLYKEFKLECIEYDNDIYEYVEEKKRAAREAEMAERNQRDRRLRGNHGKHKQEYNKENKEENWSSDLGVESPRVVTKKLQGVVARKGRGAKPTYVRLGLDDFGISDYQFVQVERNY